MQIIRSLDKKIVLKKPAVLTIGNFDGVHLGHQAVLSRLKDKASEINGETIVISFENHPSEVLRTGHSMPRLCSLEQKIKLLDKYGTDLLVLLKFTKEFSQQTPEEFLKKILSYIPFKYLILGHDATLGKDRQGDRQHINKISKDLEFNVEYLDEKSSKGILISSSKIREFVQKGDLNLAAELLGRKYSIYSHVHTGQGMGKTIGFPTLNVHVAGLCLPPLGVYAVKLKHGAISMDGVANLGKAPTVRQDESIVLEVHLFNFNETIKNEDFVEVIFYEYIRPEQRFANLSDLREQIGRDVQSAQKILG